MFDDIFRGKNVLVTGHTGFKGSWLSLWLGRLGAKVTGLSLPPPTEPCHWGLLHLDNVTDIRADLRDAEAVLAAVTSAAPDIIFHLGAQALVRRSYRNPTETFDTNVMGLVNLLEAVRKTDSVRVVVNATTDKVYAETELHHAFSETDALGGHDPYSTSKACSELITESYRKCFLGDRVRLVTARAGNVIGGGDWAEDRLVPDMIRACISGEPLMIRNPGAIRPWQHVLEPLAGYLSLAQTLVKAEQSISAWNFGPRREDELAVSGLVEIANECWPGIRVAIDDACHHPREAAVLRLDSTRAEDTLGWAPVWPAATAIARTMSWYRRFYETGELLSELDVDAYVASAKSQGALWAV